MWRAIVNAWNGVDDSKTASSSGEHPQRTPAPVLKFQDVVEIVKKKDPNTVIVDVREPGEFEVVQIPGSINVPYTSHPDGFSLNEDDFKSTFKVDKPSKNQRLVFLCAAGRRAAGAENVACENGYHNTAIYSGSMNDWVEKGGDKLVF
ncbi:thiosulfate sulfurtransferase RDL1 PWA37_001663 [Arxiozyma heterogenica]|uniref:Rhodanese domain-containing protein n=1 Tax=Arxiozyma heterogenica TaxID=278026 RepID=A0AAN7WH27_9SACH|nr:hypothetical protein RI543_002503 [Kazachstania heterogenica]